jgi:hypothetical protein
MNKWMIHKRSDMIFILNKSKDTGEPSDICRLKYNKYESKSKTNSRELLYLIKCRESRMIFGKPYGYKDTLLFDMNIK